MTNANYIQWLETMIIGCDDLGGMEREKAIYQNCLKKARNLGRNLPIQRVSNSFCDLYKKQCIGNLCSVTPTPEKCEHLKQNDC